ncbi:uncharacterized protein [Clytia hemisphaerica]|uniref:uncharacterized protein n=1 Tax=Clytia hemisphaerica TaxID=252671 RepID=UPI0034D794A7
MSVKSSPLIWTNEKEIMLLREVLVSQPHQFKEKTPKRGEKWQQIADNLNKSDQFNNKASTRAVREKTNALIHAFRQTQRAELAATGISPDPTEKEVLCEEICLQIDEFTRIHCDLVSEVQNAFFTYSFPSLIAVKAFCDF